MPTPAVSLQTQAELIEMAYAAMIIRDLDGRILFWNRQAEEIYGWAADEALGQITHTLLQTQFPVSLQALSRDLEAVGHWEGTLLHTRRDGRLITVESRQALQRSRDGGSPAILEVNLDVTAQRAAEAEVEKLNAALRAEAARLEQRVAERTAQLESALIERDAEIAERRRAEARLTMAYATLVEQAEELEVQSEELRAQNDELFKLADDLQMERSQFDAILGSMIEGLIIADLQGNVVKMNPAALRLHGFADEAMARGHSTQFAEMFQLYSLEGERLPPSAWPLERVLRGETFANYQVLVRRPATGAAWVGSYGGTPVRNHDGEPILAVLTLRDVTAQREAALERERLLAEVQTQAAGLQAANRQLQVQAATLEQQAAVFQAQNEDLDRVNRQLAEERALREAFLQQMLGGVAVVEAPSGHLILLNEQFARIVGVPARPAGPFDDYLCRVARRPDGTPYPAGATPLGRAACLGEVIKNEEMLIEHAGGLQCVVLMNATPVTDARGKTVAAVGTVYDITDRKQMEQDVRASHAALSQANARLEQRVEERSAELREANARLQATATRNAELLLEVSQREASLQASREQLQALSRRLVEVQEAERRAIARELHDEAGQALTSLMVGLGLIERETDCSSATVARIAELKRITGDVLEGLHRLAVNLRPASLDRLGLVPALEQYIESFNRQNVVQIELVTVGMDGVRLAPELETTLYRVVQEALTNVLRHAEANNAGVVLEIQSGQPDLARSEAPGEASDEASDKASDEALDGTLDRRITAIIEDDGVGFDVEQALSSGRLGIFGMRERVEMMGGSLTVESAPGAGTTVFVEIPLPA